MDRFDARVRISPSKHDPASLVRSEWGHASRAFASLAMWTVPDEPARCPVAIPRQASRTESRGTVHPAGHRPRRLSRRDDWPNRPRWPRSGQRGGAVKHAGGDTGPAEVLRIRRKRRRHPLATASLAGFRVSHGGTADAGMLLGNPCLSLYCLDEPGRRAIFVETPAGVDLTREPLLYLAQHRYAIRLLAVPYATLDAMADAAPERAPPLRLVYSCGRSGSTLLSRMFALAEGCVSLSEPDAFTQMVFMDLAPDDIVRRMRTLVWALCRPGGRDGAPLHRQVPQHVRRACRAHAPGLSGCKIAVPLPQCVRLCRLVHARISTPGPGAEPPGALAPVAGLADAGRERDTAVLRASRANGAHGRPVHAESDRADGTARASSRSPGSPPCIATSSSAKRGGPSRPWSTTISWRIRRRC